MTPKSESAPATDPVVPPDPILSKSYALPIAIASIAVVAATALAVVDEMWWRRPYKAIQGAYKDVYGAYLVRVEEERRGFKRYFDEKIDEYKALKEKAASAAAACADESAKLDRRLRNVTQQGRRLSDALKISKSEIAALTYQADVASHAEGSHVVEESDAARPILDEIERIRNREIAYSWRASDDPKATESDEEERTDSGKVGDLLEKAAQIEVEKATLQQALGAAKRAATDASKEAAAWLARNLSNLQYTLDAATPERKKQYLDRMAAEGIDRFLERDLVALAPDVVSGLLREVERIPSGLAAPLRGDIRQIHIAEANNWVDRCETCHLNAASNLPVTVDAMRTALSREFRIPPATEDDEETVLPAWTKAQLDAAPLALFASHPTPELLRRHDPQKFGCSMCHNGNGVAINSVEQAHGTNKHWLQPLFPRQNLEAGCLQCHRKDLVLPLGPRLTAGREAFRRNGCWGCHKYEGYNPEPDRLVDLEGRIRSVRDAVAQKSEKLANLDAAVGALGDLSEDALDKAAAERDARRTALKQEIATDRTELDQLEVRRREAYVERQRVGPNLKDVRVKLRPEFVTQWIEDPRSAHAGFRPDTKMPTFRWWGDAGEEVRDVAAFIWQSALGPEEFPEYWLAPFVPGDAARGEELLKTVGCLACHSIGRGERRIGGDFAANLSDLGEKDRPEYVMRWITNPRRRLVAFDPDREPGSRDVTGASAADPHLVWTQHTPMPNFRLTEADARDVTTFLVASRRPDVKYEAAPWLDDKSRFERGRKLVLFQGCAGCHEIHGLESEKGIGTELTTEGSKPLDQLDFGHHTIAAQRGEEPLRGWKSLADGAEVFTKDEPWYRPRGFFMHKLAKPDLYDDSKYLPDRTTRLRMPQFRLAAQQIHDLTTFLLGSVAPGIPGKLHYDPDEAGDAIREGWWIVRKYNCQACHTIVPGEEPSIWKAPGFAESLGKAADRDRTLPPNLVHAGFRLQPEFLTRFLRDPSLGGGRERPSSVRAHLKVRMPTFDLSDAEIAKLVRFFEALAKQPPGWRMPAVEPLTEAEHRAATAIFKDQGSCNLCHVYEGAKRTDETKAPNFAYAPGRLRPEYMRRWIPHPADMQPNTSMTEFFGKEPRADGRWHYLKDLPEMKGVDTDQVELMIRYILSGLAGK